MAVLRNILRLAVYINSTVYDSIPITHIPPPPPMSRDVAPSPQPFPIPPPNPSQWIYEPTFLKRNVHLTIIVKIKWKLIHICSVYSITNSLTCLFTHSLICLHNALVSHLKLVPGFWACLYRVSFFYLSHSTQVAGGPYSEKHTVIGFI